MQPGRPGSQRPVPIPSGAADAFAICHEVYAAAREMLDRQIGVIRLEASEKYLWRPDNRPRLAEYVADFALAGERALAPTGQGSAGWRGSGKSRLEAGGTGGGPPRLDGTGRETSRSQGRRAGSLSLRASRLILFRVYYLGGAEYHAARKFLGISENTWAAWAEEVRERVGRELIRAGVFPPGRYFRESSRDSLGSRRAGDRRGQEAGRRQ